jgi:hypothetical protein
MQSELIQLAKQNRPQLLRAKSSILAREGESAYNLFHRLAIVCDFSAPLLRFAFLCGAVLQPELVERRHLRVTDELPGVLLVP